MSDTTTTTAPAPAPEAPGRFSAEQLLAALAAPFEAGEVKAKPAAVSGNRALAIFYVDARVIQDRLDSVVGVAGWSDDYTVLPDGCVSCKLRCKIDGEWITKMDVGGKSEQPDEGDQMKAAFSDSLKRAAVKFGVGRYLYRTPSVWCDYDPQKRQFVRPPALPAAALPARDAGPPAPKPSPGAAREATLKAAAERYRREWRLPQLIAQTAGKHQAIDQLSDTQAKWVQDRLAVLARHQKAPPERGPVLLVWIEELEAQLVHEGACQAHDALRVLTAAADLGHGETLTPWPEWKAEHCRWAWEQLRAWGAERRKAKAGPPRSPAPQPAA